jgi:hypothetical protein
MCNQCSAIFSQNSFDANISGVGFRQADLLPQCVIFRLSIFFDCVSRAVRQVRFEVVDVPAETGVLAFFREIVLRFAMEQVVDKHGRS